MLRVLVVEDNVQAALSLSALLRMEGYEVEVAYDGPTGLHRGRWWRPDVVLLDLGLPGIDGWQVADLLKATQTEKKPLVVAITGYGSEADRDRSDQSGIDLHLVKPTEPEKLHALLHRFSLVAAP